MSSNYEAFHSLVRIDLDTYLREFRDEEKFLVYCQACEQYNARWSCPPFDFDHEAFFRQWNFANIVGTKVVIEVDFIERNQWQEKSAGQRPIRSSKTFGVTWIGGYWR